MEPKKLDEKVLAIGEATGHAHRVTVDVYEQEDKTRTFLGPTTVTHEEHRPVVLPQKEFASGIVVEYDHFAEEVKNVQD